MSKEERRVRGRVVWMKGGRKGLMEISNSMYQDWLFHKKQSGARKDWDAGTSTQCPQGSCGVSSRTRTCWHRLGKGSPPCIGNCVV